MTISAAEQYAIEQINRGRLDPQAEADRQGIALNAGLAAGSIDATAKQVLAPHDALDGAATGHALWMLQTGTFSHYGAGGSDPEDRMKAAGYAFTGSWGWGENISVRSVSGNALQALIDLQLADLYASAGHRANTFDPAHREIGLSQEIAYFRTWGQSAMLVENFAHRASVAYVTGVIFQDADSDSAYSIGEGLGGVALALTGGAVTVSAAAGGYGLAATAGAVVTLTIGPDTALGVDLAGGNVKVDLMDDQLLVSGSVDLICGIGRVVGLGVGDFNIAGHEGANRLQGSDGHNRLSGEAGRDTLVGGKGRDTLLGDGGNDLLAGGQHNDRLEGGIGADTLRGDTGNDWLSGGNGNDRLAGGAGNDTLTGGAGADQFWFQPRGGSDRVTDFSLTQLDRLMLDDALWSGGLTAAAVVAGHAQVTAQGVSFVFDDGTGFTLMGLTTLDGLEGAIGFL